MYVAFTVELRNSRLVRENHLDRNFQFSDLFCRYIALLLKRLNPCLVTTLFTYHRPARLAML